MKRRSKLNLSSGKDPNKQQPSGFEVEEPEPPRATKHVKKTNASGVRKRAERAKASKPEIENVSAVEKETVTPQASWSGPGQLAKALMVVAATALSLYLLKRRFF